MSQYQSLWIVHKLWQYPCPAPQAQSFEELFFRGCDVTQNVKGYRGASQTAVAVFPCRVTVTRLMETDGGS